MGFPRAVRAEPVRAQGCLLNSFLTAHLGSGAAAEHFVCLVWAKWCSGSRVSHPSPAAWLCHPISSSAAPAPDTVFSSWMWPLSLAEPSLVPCALAGIQASLQHPPCLPCFPKNTVMRAWLVSRLRTWRGCFSSEPICLVPQRLFFQH